MVRRFFVPDLTGPELAQGLEDTVRKKAYTHNGVKTMLGLHFTSKGKLSVSASKTFATLFEKRHSSDYDDFVYCDQEMIDDLYPKAEAFIAEVKELIENSGESPGKNI